MQFDPVISHALDQVAALPVRLHDEGFVEVMLITSRRSKRWIIPKGWPEAGLAPHQVAEKEAIEEAGLVGTADVEPFGFFTYDKRLTSGPVLPCRVAVHLLHVTGQLERWREHGQRSCVWMGAREASRQVCNLALQRLIRKAGRSPERLRFPVAGASIRPAAPMLRP